MILTMGYANIIYLLFILFYVFFLPGYLIIKQSKIKNGPIETFALGLGLSLVIMPILCFSIAMILRTYVGELLVFLVASAVNISFVLLFVSSKREGKKAKPIAKGDIIVIILMFLVFAFYTINFQGPATNYWDTYITAPAMFIANNEVDFVDIDGEIVYNYELEGRLPDDLVNEEEYGIITKDQRIGTGIYFSLPFLYLGILGFRIFYAISGALIACFGFLTASRIFRNEGIGIFAGILLSLNPFIISVNNLNANTIGLMIVSMIIYLLLKKKTNWLLVGILYGVLGGIRNVTLILGPAIVAWMYMRNGTKRQLMILAAGAIIAIIPILFWNQFAFGGMLTHPTQYSELEGFRPTFEHRFIFWDFEFNGLLNYPFHNILVRTPHFAFPTFLTIPFVIANSFGTVLVALSFFGFNYLWKKDRRLTVFFLLLFIPFFLFLAVQENWEELKTTFILLIFGPLVMFMAAGLKWLMNNLGWKTLLKVTVVSIVLMIMIQLSSNIDVPVDERWYERFPHAINSESGLAELEESDRNSWEFFYTAETREEYEQQKRKLTRGNLFPALYEPFQPQVSVVSYGLQKKELTTLEIWDYIYG